MKENLTETIIALNNSELSSYKIAQDTGISDQTIINYRNGTTVPRGNNLKTLSKYLGITNGDKTEVAPIESSNETITMPLVVWKVIEDQAASLRAKDESLKIKDQQVSEILDHLKIKDDQVERLIAKIDARNEKMEEAVGLLKEHIKKGENVPNYGHAAIKAG